MSTHDPRRLRRASLRRRRAARLAFARRPRLVAGRAARRKPRFVWPVLLLIAQVTVAVMQLVGALVRLLEP